MKYRIFNLFILLTIFTHEILTITTGFAVKHQRRHIEPQLPPDWELGLREATNQALGRERHADPDLRDRLYDAPLDGRQDVATPFGDITILARGQLYGTSTGYRFVQDPYSNDCDDCHTHGRKPQPCATLWGCRSTAIDHRNGQLLALWSVKRIRHRNAHYGHAYELEYTISPIHAAIGDGFLQQNGRFNYNIPGHVFVIRSDGERDNQVVVRPNRWYRNRQPIIHDELPPGVTEDALQLNPKPGILIEIANTPTTPNALYIPVNRPTNPTTQDPREFVLYQNLLESLASKTTTPDRNYLESPHRFSLPPTTAATSTKPTYQFMPSYVSRPETTFANLPTPTSNDRTTIRYSEPDPYYQNTQPEPTKSQSFLPITMPVTLHFFTPVDDPSDDNTKTSESMQTNKISTILQRPSTTNYQVTSIETTPKTMATTETTKKITTTTRTTTTKQPATSTEEEFDMFFESSSTLPPTTTMKITTTTMPQTTTDFLEIEEPTRKTTPKMKQRKRIKSTRRKFVPKSTQPMTTTTEVPQQYSSTSQKITSTTKQPITTPMSTSAPTETTTTIKTTTNKVQSTRRIDKTTTQQITTTTEKTTTKPLTTSLLTTFINEITTKRTTLPTISTTTTQIPVEKNFTTKITTAITENPTTTEIRTTIYKTTNLPLNETTKPMVTYVYPTTIEMDEKTIQKTIQPETTTEIQKNTTLKESEDSTGSETTYTATKLTNPPTTQTTSQTPEMQKSSISRMDDFSQDEKPTKKPQLFDFDDLFGEESEKPSPTTTLSAKSTTEAMDSDFAKELFGNSRKSKQLNLSGKNKPKIIFSNFYTPSTTLPTLHEKNMTIEKEITNNPITPNNLEEPFTDQSISTSISIQINKKKRMDSDDKTNHIKIQDEVLLLDPTIPAKVKEVISDKNDYRVFKAEFPEIEAKNTSPTPQGKLSDDFALQLVNHARSIDYLTRRSKMQFKRRNYRTKSKKITRN